MRRIRFGLVGLVLTMACGAQARAPDTAPPLWHRSVAIDYRIHADGTADSTETWAVRADTIAVAHIIAQQSFSFIADLDRVTLLDAYTMKPGGERIEARPAAVMDQAVTTVASAPQFSDQRSRTIVFPSVGAGDVVHYTLQRQGTAPLFPGEFTATLHAGPLRNIDRADFSLSLPPGMTLRVETAGLDEQAPERLDDGGLVRRWQRAAGEEGAVLLDASSFADYPALGRAYAARAWPRSQPGPAVTALALLLTDGVTDEREEALRLYRYVATEIRYVATFLGDGRVVPRDAATVLAEGFGDCKDHAALLQALLAARGIAAQPALISLRNLYTLPNAAGLGALNHVITYVPALDLYLDSTAPYAPFGLLPADEYDKPVVLSAPGAARLARTPVVPPVALDVQTTTAAKIGADDAVSGTTTTAASGPQGIALRAMAAWIEGRGPAGAASLQLRQLGTPGTGGFSFEPPERDAPAYQVHARFRLDEALIDGGAAPFPLPGGLGVFERPGLLLLGSAMTEEGGHVCYPGQETETVALTLPAGAVVRTVPPDVTAEAGGARYAATYRVADGVLLVHRVFVVSTARVFCEAVDYALMRGVLAVARRDQRVQVSLVRAD